MRGGRGFFFVRDEALVKYRNLMSKWATTDWKTKWSKNTGQRRYRRQWSRRLSGRTAEIYLWEPAREFAEEPPQFTVFIPISGIDLKVPTFQVGEVEVLEMTRALADELIAKATEMVADKGPEVQAAI